MVSSLTHQKHLSSILLEHNDLADLERLLVEQMNWAKKVGITMLFSCSYKWYFKFNKFGVFLLKKEGLGLGWNWKTSYKKIVPVKFSNWRFYEVFILAAKQNIGQDIRDKYLSFRNKLKDGALDLLSL